MTDSLPNLGLPLILPAQAQKHVTHNEALAVLDAGVQLVLEELSGIAPPAAPAEGACHGVGAGATGAWAGQGGRVAVAEGAGWRFLTPGEGWLAWDRAGARLVSWDGAAWEAPGWLGVNTGADATNRLAVAAEAVLFTHDGGDQRLKLNKAGATDTASLVFQSGWSGRAEMGLAGGDGFSIKVSADGTGWTTALSFDAATAAVSGQAVQQSASDTAPGRLMLAEHGITRPGLLGAVTMNAGVPTGAVIERGADAGGEWVKWADGTALVSREVTVDINTDSSQNFDFPIALTTVLSGSIVGSDETQSSGSNVRAALAALPVWVTSTGWRVRLQSAIAASTVTCRLSASGLWL